MNASPTGDNVPSLGSFYTYKNTFDKDVHWVQIPKVLKFHNVTDPYSDDSSKYDQLDRYAGDFSQTDSTGPWNRDQPAGLNTHGLEALSAAALSAPLQARSLAASSLSIAQEEQRLNTPNMLQVPAASASVESPIDPILVAPRGPATPSQGHDVLEMSPQSVRLDTHEQASNDLEAEQKIDALLTNLNEAPAQWPPAQQEPVSEKG